MSKRRVVITGLGMVSPVGNDVRTAWEAIQAGRSGIGMIDRFDASEYNTRIGGAVKNLDIGEYLSAKDARKLDAFIHYGLIAAQQAVDDSGLGDYPALDRDRVGVAIGSGIGGLEFIEKSVIQMDTAGPRKVSPFFVPASVINMISGNVAIRFGYRGPNIAIVTACTTGTHNIGLRRPHHRLRRCRRDAGRRLRDGHHPDRRGGVLRCPGPVHPQRRTGKGQPALGS